MPKKRIIKNNGGYSLVELMVVITIMAILAAEAYFIEYSESFDGDEEAMEEMAEDLCELTYLDVEVLEDPRDYSGDEDSYGVIVKKKSGKWICNEVLCDVNGEVWKFDTENGEFQKRK